MSKIVLLIFIFIFFIFAALNLGNLLDVKQKYKDTEAYISLGGGDTHVRIKKAIDLYEKSIFKNKVLIITGGTNFTKEDMLQDDRIALISKNYPNINFEYNPNLKNTYEELFFLKKYLIFNNITNITIVSDPYHTRRIQLLSKLIGFDNIEVVISSTTLSWWNSEEYYKSIRSFKTAVIELIKIPFNIIKYTFITAI